MGEVAEMMLDGTLCEQCGTFIGEPVGYPRLCEDCQCDDDYDFGEYMRILGVCADEIIKNGTPEQKQKLIKRLYAKLDKLKKGLH